MAQQDSSTTVKSGRRFCKASFCSFFFAVLSLFLGLSLAVLICLPGAVQHEVGKILNRLSKEDAFTLKVKYIGLYRTELSLYTTDQAQPGAEALRISSCSLRYRPLRLFRGEVDQIELEGVRLTLDLTPGNSPLPLLKLFPEPAGQTAAPAKELRVSEWASKLPVHFSHLNLRGDLLLLTGQEVIPLAIRLEFRPGRVPEHPEWDWEMSLKHSRNTLYTSGSCDLAGAAITANSRFYGTVNALPYSLRQHLPADLDVELGGLVSFSFDLDSRKFTAVQAEIETGLNYRRGNMQVACHPRLTLNTEQDQIIAELHGLQAQMAGTNVTVEKLSAKVSRNDLNTIDAYIQAGIQQQIVLAANFQIRRENGRILLQANSQPVEEQLPECKLDRNGYSLNFKAPKFSLSAELSPALQYQITASIENGKFSAAGQDAALGSLTFAAQGQNSAANLQASISNLQLSQDGSVNCSIPELQCQASFQDGRLQGSCRIPEGSAELPEQDLVANFSAEIPLRWPLSGPDIPEGFFRVDSLLGKGEMLGSLEGHFQINEHHLDLDGSTDLRGLKATFNAGVFPFAGLQDIFLQGRFELPEQPLPSNLPPAKFVPQLKGFQCEGKLAAGGTFTVRKNAEMRGEAFVKIIDGQLRQPEKDFSLNGLRLEFKMPELPKISSSGNQLLAFRNLEFGKFAIRSGRVRFRMEGPDSWHLENVTMNWCDGKLKLDSTRINPDNKRTSLIFHCDRLRLSTLLQQLGAGQDQGEGRISGTIPIVISSDGLRFRDAFLYSTPGEPGTIKLLPSKSISATAAASDQLSFALDALANFTYSWVKLSLDSEKDQLKIKLQTDGRPAGKLYYIPKDGTLVRSEVANDFTGLQLDANLNIPLNNTLQLYQNFKRLLIPQ